MCPNCNGVQGIRCTDCYSRHMDGMGSSRGYMVRDEIWRRYGADVCHNWEGKPWRIGAGRGFLCLFCLEQRMGRSLVLEDLTPAPINDWLIDRLGGPSSRYIVFSAITGKEFTRYQSLDMAMYIAEEHPFYVFDALNKQIILPALKEKS